MRLFGSECKWCRGGCNFKFVVYGVVCNGLVIGFCGGKCVLLGIFNKVIVVY